MRAGFLWGLGFILAVGFAYLVVVAVAGVSVMCWEMWESRAKRSNR